MFQEKRGKCERCGSTELGLKHRHARLLDHRGGTEYRLRLCKSCYDELSQACQAARSEDDFSRERFGFFDPDDPGAEGLPLDADARTRILVKTVESKSRSRCCNEPVGVKGAVLTEDGKALVRVVCSLCELEDRFELFAVWRPPE
jgi:hypothetical protein